MNITRTSSRGGRGGMAHVLALVFLVLLNGLAVALVSGTMLNLRAGDNYRRAVDAQLAAESGMDFMLNQIRSVRIPQDTNQETMPANIAEALGALLNTTANLASQSVTVSTGTVYVPGIQLPYGSFSCTLAPDGDKRCRLVVRGSAQGVQRSVAIDLVMTPKHSTAFDYGLASFGPVSIVGNARIVGVNDPSEASVLAADTSGGAALSLAANALIAGDLTVVNNAPIAISGSPSLGGTTDPELMADHILSVPEPPEAPALDIGPIAALATNVVDSSTHTSSPGLTFSNIRIAAGTNPTFASDVVINGVVYVEAPNNVTFSGNSTINGMVVTEDSDNPIQSCQLNFAGGMQAFGVETLPDTPEFAEVRQHTGTFVVAPGFGVTFSAQFSTINGTIAADQLTFTGQAGGIVNGAVIGLSERPMALDGGVEIHVDRLNAYPNPAGFVETMALEPDPASYTELVGG